MKTIHVVLSEKNDQELRKRNHRKGDLSNTVNQALKDYLTKQGEEL